MTWKARTVQEFLDHKDVSTTMIHTHVLNRGPSGSGALLTTSSTPTTRARWDPRRRLTPGECPGAGQLGPPPAARRQVSLGSGAVRARPDRANRYLDGRGTVSQLS